jgi:hypothetical protein
VRKQKKKKEKTIEEIKTKNWLLEDQIGKPLARMINKDGELGI